MGQECVQTPEGRLTKKKMRRWSWSVSRMLEKILDVGQDSGMLGWRRALKYIFLCFFFLWGLHIMWLLSVSKCYRVKI